MSKVLSSSSITKNDVNSLTTFSDVSFCKEIDELCPVLSSALKGAAGVEENDGFAQRTLCYGSLFKSRYTNRKNVIAHRNDQLLIAAGVKRSSFKLFNCMGFTNSYSTALRQNTNLSKDHDKEVLLLVSHFEDHKVCDLVPRASFLTLA